MTDLPTIFRDADYLQRQFVDGLEQMLDTHDSLGVFVLVLANATYDERIYECLRAALQERFSVLSLRVQEVLRSGRQIDDAGDDVIVFLKLMVVGLDKLPLARFRKEGAFELQFNLLRALRPPRTADRRIERVFEPFSPDGFHFNKPFLNKEILWEGELYGRDCRLLYNKFPFAHLHGLLVVEPGANKPQYLAQDDHQLIWALCRGAGRQLAGIGYGYNSYGAYASVNHQHFQMFCHPAGGYPVESGHWQHNTGSERYPCECLKLSDRDEAWYEILKLHDRNLAYTLLYRPGCVYLFPRRFQGDYAHSPWTSGFAWSELAGSVTTFNSEYFEQITEREIRAEMERLALSHPL